MSDTESFEQAMDFANTVVAYCDIPLLDRLQAAHDREIRDTAQQEYDRGFHDGQHSMDAEHRAVAMRLRALNFADGRCHDSLNEIAHAVYPEYRYAWMHGSALRDELVRLMGGVSDDTCDSQCRGACADFDGDCGLQREEVTDERLADDSGADTGCGDGGGDLHMDGVRITDELREWASDRHCKGMSHTDVLNIGLIADRIDEQFDRICEQQEAVLQSTIERMADENLTAKDERDHWKREASELQAKLDEYDRTHVELPRDANGKVFNIGCAVKPVKRDTKLAYTVSYMDLAKDGWRIGIRLDQYRLKYKPQTFEVCDAKPDPIEDTIEKLTLGEITQTEAIERIKSYHGTARRE